MKRLPRRLHSLGRSRLTRCPKVGWGRVAKGGMERLSVVCQSSMAVSAVRLGRAGRRPGRREMYVPRFGQLATASSLRPARLPSRLCASEEPGEDQVGERCTYLASASSLRPARFGQLASGQLASASSLRPARFGQLASASSLRPARFGQLASASSLRPARFGQLASASSLRPARFGQLASASSLRPARFGQLASASSLRPARFGQLASASSLRLEFFSCH